MKKRIAIVTGASGGLGKEFVRQMLSENVDEIWACSQLHILLEIFKLRISFFLRGAAGQTNQKQYSQTNAVDRSVFHVISPLFSMHLTAKVSLNKIFPPSL